MVKESGYRLRNLVIRKNTYLLSVIYLIIVILYGIGCRHTALSFLEFIPKMEIDSVVHQEVSWYFYMV